MSRRNSELAPLIVTTALCSLEVYLAFIQHGTVVGTVYTAWHMVKYLRFGSANESDDKTIMCGTASYTERVSPPLARTA